MRRREGLAYAVATGLLAACAPRPAPPAPGAALAPPITYVALGASDATGFGVDNPQEDGWVPVLARRLPQPARLVNLGIPGIKLREAIDVELPPVADANPHLITVWLVVNDILGGVSLEQYRSDLDRLLTQLKATTRAYVAVGNVPTASEGSHYLGLSADERRAIAELWNDAIAAVVRGQRAILVDLATHWSLAQHPEYIGPDGLHPTVAGYRSLAETFLAVLREARIV